ncbi:MAG: AAA family ATPase, partial [Acidobacteriota bacterium]
MQLIRLEIQGFKSFARPLQLDFAPGLTAIVGPNGSGKSNIADAIRWVLGEQSTKMLRGKERTDVIFSGTQARPAARKARVTLVFSNETEGFPVEAPEVAITRTLALTGESTYQLNGEPILLADLHQLLAAARLGTKSYTVISQGMVDHYLTANPTARRELFDEATGIKALQLKLARAEQKMASTRQY